MKVIVTKQNRDGSFDEVGMNNRALISHLKTEWRILKWADEYANGKPHRIEYFNNIYSNPIKTIYR